MTMLSSTFLKSARILRLKQFVAYTEVKKSHFQRFLKCDWSIEIKTDSFRSHVACQLFSALCLHNLEMKSFAKRLFW